jgi:uncharacterized membrane protein
MDREDIARRLFEKGLETLTPREQNVVRRFVHRLRVSRNVHREYEESLTLGQRLADRVASFGGSWTFIGIFAVILVTWVALNSYILLRWHHTFDPYPYILLNLFLSMLAAIQAPIIMMSQNRQSTKDRVRSEHDYEVNLKAELEIMALHDKLDALREKQWNELLALQQEQIQMLGKLVDAMGRPQQQGPDPGPHGKA